MTDPVTLPREVAMRLAAYTRHGDECSIADPASAACSCGLSATLQEWRTAMTGGTETSAEPYSIRAALSAHERTAEIIRDQADDKSRRLNPPARQSLASAPHGGGELRDAIARVSAWANYPYTTADQVAVQSEASTFTAGDLRTILAALSQEAEPPHCQKCGGEVHGWICQLCGQDFEENDAGKLVFMAEQEAEPVAWQPISEHDGSDTPVDLWAGGRRWTDFFREDGRRWVRKDGYPVATRVLTTPPTHFMVVPAAPDDRGGEVKG